MNKKLIASVAAACVLSVGTVFAAANPFADVSPNDWSYDAVKTLAQAGLIDGYSDGTFQGNKSITRYEMAQLVAKAMYRSDKATLEQKKTIDKLSAEYKVELENLGVRMDKVEKETSGVKDLKVTGWFQTENSYGHRADQYDLHEYALKARIGVEKQVSEKLSYTHQFETLTYLDAVSADGNNNNAKEYPNSNKEGVHTRLSYLTYKASPITTITAGKYAIWLAGGLLADDFVKGVTIDTKLGNHINWSTMVARYETNPSQQLVQDKDGKWSVARSISDQRLVNTSLTGKAGPVDLGVHYLGSNSGYVYDRDVKIYAATAGIDVAGINFQFGYGKNNEEDDQNQVHKVQAYKKISGTDVFLQYWKQQSKFNPPIETGNHMAWWADMYGNWGGEDGLAKGGLKGYRVILARPINPNTTIETFYGDFKNMATNEKGKKYGFDVILTF